VDRLTRLGLTLIAAAFSGCAATGAPKDVATPVAPASMCSVRDGTALDPFAGEQGSLVALVFISTECPIANAMAPDLRSLCHHCAMSEVDFHPVYPSAWQSREELLAHSREFGLDAGPGPTTAPIADPKHILVERVGATVVPEAVLLRRDGAGGVEVLYRGRVNDLYVGIGRRRPTISSNDLRDAIDAAVAGSPLPPPFPKAVGCFIDSFR
jgi:hypothetical protein